MHINFLLDGTLSSYTISATVEALHYARALPHADFVSSFFGRFSARPHQVKLFKQCAIKNALFVGTDAEGADSDGCGAVVADNEAVTNGLDEVSNKVKELVDKDVAKVRADTTKATAGIAALNKGILKCGEQNKLLLGDIDAADDDGCGEALLAVANQSASATVRGGPSSFFSSFFFLLSFFF